MATKNNPGNFDCYTNAEADEPMFILLGRDAMAPSLVEGWAYARELDGEDADKVAEARTCAASMREWLATLGKKERPVSAIDSYLWRAHIRHGITSSDFYILTCEKERSHAVSQIQALIDNPDEFIARECEIRSVEFLGHIAA